MNETTPQEREDQVAVSQPRGHSVTAALSGAVFVVLAVLVAIGTTQQLDVAARELFRPADRWGATQLRVNVVVEGLKPVFVAPALAVFGVVAALLRSSWRPAVLVAAMGVVTVLLTLSAKFAVQRADPHYEMTALGGSFPSGHTVMLMVALGAVLLVLRGSIGWWGWALVAAGGLAMGLSLLLQAAHWLTDVVGGGVLAVTVLAAVDSPRRRPAREDSSAAERPGGVRRPVEG